MKRQFAALQKSENFARRRKSKPNTGKPLRVIGPSGRTPRLGTQAMVDGMKNMAAWHLESFLAFPTGDGYETEVTEFDFKDDGGICYDKNGVTVRHWRRSHTVDGASVYRLDWNGLSFVWTAMASPMKSRPNMRRGVFVSEMVVDNPVLWGLKQGIPMEIDAFTLDSFHSPGYGVGYLANQINPRIAMATHFSFDHELLGEGVAEVRRFWKGMFTWGIDHTVVNVTKDALWIREAALPDTANTTKPTPQWMLQEMFGGVMPKEFVMPNAKNSIPEIQEQSVRDLEIKPELYTPPDQIRKWVRAWPAGLKMDPAALMGTPPAKK